MTEIDHEVGWIVGMNEGERSLCVVRASMRTERVELGWASWTSDMKSDGYDMIWGALSV